MKNCLSFAPPWIVPSTIVITLALATISRGVHVSKTPSQLLGLASTSSVLGSVVAVDTSTGSAATLSTDPAAAVTSGSALNTLAKQIYMLEDDFVLHNFDLTNNSFGQKLLVNLDQCVGGGTCINELHFNPSDETILAIGMGICLQPTHNGAPLTCTFVVHFDVKVPSTF